MIAILDRLQAEKKTTESQIGKLDESSDSYQDERDWDGDDTDEGIIYVD